MSKLQKSKAAPAVSRKARRKVTSGKINPLGVLDPPLRPKASRKAHANGGEGKTRASVTKTDQSATGEPKHALTENPEVATGQRKRRRKQVRLSVAMRKIGLDEYMVAEGLAGLIERLGTNRGEAKVLLDVLKESTRFLEPPLKAQDADESDGQNGVVLRHGVPRPARHGVQGQDETELGAPEAR